MTDKKQRKRGKEKCENEFKKLNVLVLGGHDHGCNALWALMTMETLNVVFNVAGLWADWKNNEENRLWRHELNLRTARNKIVRYARLLGLPGERILKKPFDGEELCRLITLWKIDVIVIATYGGLVPQEAIDKVNGRVYVCHPCFAMEEEVDRLPMISRGAKVMDKIVRKGGIQAEMQIALLRANAKFDDGPIVGITPVFAGPLFMRRANFSARILKAQELSAQNVGTLLRSSLIVNVVPVEEVVKLGFSKRKLIKLGYTIGALRKAGLKFK